MLSSVHFYGHTVCQAEYNFGIVWERRTAGQQSRVSCSDFHPIFNAGIYITRRCNNNGEWGEADFSSCTVRITFTPLTPLIMVEVKNNYSTPNISLLTDMVSIIV